MSRANYFYFRPKKKFKNFKNCNKQKKTLAVRFPRHPVARELLKKIGFPLAAPSANLSSKVSSVNSEDVKEDFGNKIKYILEGGNSKIGVESTIVDLRKKSKVLRLGGTEISTIKKILGKEIFFYMKK